MVCISHYSPGGKRREGYRWEVLPQTKIYYTTGDDEVVKRCICQVILIALDVLVYCRREGQTQGGTGSIIAVYEVHSDWLIFKPAYCLFLL